ncbi:MAG: hypothetical protein MUC29_06615 [Pyrinomonadaceae bacterium]|jgi:hypothetical protein|nr:hypothetical protein [Pyrinomonadaceae bacterium]
MRKRNLPENESANRVKREKDPIPWRYCILTLVFGVLLVGGFFFAARQHFGAVNLSMENDKLRKQRDELETGNRRLVLEKEKSLSYEELEKTAHQIGLVKLGSQAVAVVSDVKETVTKTFLPKNQESINKKTTEKKKNSDKNDKSETKNDETNEVKDKNNSKSETEKKSNKDEIKTETKNSKPIGKTGK